MSEPQESLQSKGTVEGVLRGGLAVGAAVALAKLSGLIWNWVLLWAFKDRAVTDAYLFASGVIFAALSVAQQSVAPAFLPLFIETRAKQGPRAAWRFAAAVVLLVAAISSAAAVAAAVFPGAWARLSAMLSGKEPSSAAAEMLSTGICWMAPALVGVSASVVTYMALNAYKRFFWAHAGEVVMRFVMIAGVVVAAGFEGSSAAKWLAVGVVAGAFARPLVHLVALGGRLVERSETVPPQTVATLKRFLLLAAPLLVGVLFSTLRDLVNHYAVLWPTEGLVTANSNGRRIFTATGELVPMSLSIAMFPFLCEMVDRNDTAALGGLLTRSARVLAMFFFPFSAAVVALSEPLAYVIFGSTGRLSAEELSLTALANACYVTVLPAYAVEFLVVRAFFSTRKMIAPTATGIVFSFMSVGISLLAVGVWRLDGRACLAAVALGYVVTRYLKLAVLIILLRRTVPAFAPGELGAFLLKAMAAAAAAAFGAMFMRYAYEYFIPLQSTLACGRSGMLIRVTPLVVLGGLASAGCAFGAVRFLAAEELLLALEWFRRARAKDKHSL